MTPAERAAKLFKDRFAQSCDRVDCGCPLPSEVAEAIAAAVAEEREACAKVCDTRKAAHETGSVCPDFACESAACAYAIRSRGGRP